MALNANALTTLDTFRDHMAIPSATLAADADLSARMERWINATSDAIEQLTGRKLVNQSVTEFQDGRRSDRILLREWPVTAVTTLHIDGGREFLAASLVDASDYSVSDEGLEIIYFDSVFPRGNHNIKIVYDAGYVTIPADLELACLLYSEWFFRMRDREDIGRTSKSKSGESTAIEPGVPASVSTLLLPYKRLDFPLGEVGVGNR